MTILVSLVFIAAIFISASTILASLQSSKSRIFDIVEERALPETAAPTIRIGEVKHYKIALQSDVNIATGNDDRVIDLPLNLTNSISDEQLPLAA